MEPLYDSVAPLPGAGFGEVDGHFGYRVYKEYVEYVDLDKWTGDSKPRYWSHQEFYNQFKNKSEDLMANGVIEFLISNKLVKLIN